MFRFTIRDMLWVTAVIGLALVWRQEDQARQRSLEVLNRNGVVADEGALGGRWEVMKITSNGKTEEFDGKPAAQMAFFGDGWWREIAPNDGPITDDGECKIVRPGELNVDKASTPGITVTTKWRYKLVGGKLWMIRSNNPGDRPSDFDAANDPDLTLYFVEEDGVGAGGTGVAAAARGHWKGDIATVSGRAWRCPYRSVFRVRFRPFRAAELWMGRYPGRRSRARCAPG